MANLETPMTLLFVMALTARKTPLATKDDVGVIDYIMNNFDVTNQKVYGSPNYYNGSTCEQSMFSIFDVTNYL